MAFNAHSFFKSSDARGFLFFLLLTSIMAILIKLSKSYSKTYKTSVSILNVPIDKTIKDISPKEIEFTTQLTGFSLLLNSFRNQEVGIEFNSLDSLSTSTFTFDTENLSLILEDVIPGGETFSTFKTKLITVDVDNMSGKKVAVLSNVVLNFESGYDVYDVPIIKPDSVTVVGPQGILDKISNVRTIARTMNEIRSDVKLTLEIDTLAAYKSLTISDSKFVYEQKVAKYTEGSFSLPVTIKGAQEKTIKIFPKTVTLYFVASLEEYDSILPTDFEILADFTKNIKNEEFVVLSVTRKPDNVRKVRLETKQIKFIVVN